MTHKDAICASFGDGTRRESRQPKQEIVRQILLRVVDVTGEGFNAGAHKLARLLYRMLRFGKAYVETGQQAYEKLFKEPTLRNLQRKARELGFDVTPMASTALVS